MDPLLCLEDDIKKAQNNKEIVVAMFLDVEKAHDMPWRKGLLIKLHQLGIGENMFSWLRDFFFYVTELQVKIGSHVSEPRKGENGTPQGSVVSPTLFSVMINGIFKDMSVN